MDHTRSNSVALTAHAVNAILTAHAAHAAPATYVMFPGTYQPSGYINVSRAREFYLSFDYNPPDVSMESES